MLVAGQLRFTVFSFILDNYCSGLSKNTNRCRKLLKRTMSNNEHTLTDTSESNRDISQEAGNNQPSFSYLNDINFRRTRSAENISSWWTGEPYCYYNWNWPPFYSPQQAGYFWNSGPSYPVASQYYPGYGSFPGVVLNTVQDNYFFHGVGPPTPPCSAPYNLFSSRSESNMQRRSYSIRKNNSNDSIPEDIGINAEILKVLSKRYWEDIRKKKRSSKSGVEFTLMSYNVLAQDLVDDHMYLYKNHNPRSLYWEKRWKNLFNEISKLMPDIMCLQEVQESHLSGFYDKLESLGYKSIYKKRTGIRCDGCAIYYKTDKFNLVEYETVEFYQPNVDVLNRDNVAIVAKFSPRISPQSEFIVATTHLLYNPKRQDVRLAQTQLLLTEIERLSFHRKSRDQTPSYWPIILTGDFNSTPDSAVYELITKGVLRYDHLSARRLDDSNTTCQGNILVPQHLEITDKCQHARLVQKRQKMETITRTEEAALIKLHNSDKTIAKISSEVIENPSLFCSGTLSHLFAFKSVYSHGDPDNVEGTTYQDKWLSVDYIFYSGKKREENSIKDGKLKLMSRYRLPRRSELGSMKIPNGSLGSDHLSLIAKFKLRI